MSDHKLQSAQLLSVTGGLTAAGAEQLIHATSSTPIVDSMLAALAGSVVSFCVPALLRFLYTFLTGPAVAQSLAGVNFNSANVFTHRLSTFAGATLAFALFALVWPLRLAAIPQVMPGLMLALAALFYGRDGGRPPLAPEYDSINSGDPRGRATWSDSKLVPELR